MNNGNDQLVGASPPTPETSKDTPTPINHEPKFKWKFVDANAFIHQGILKLVEADDFQKLDFVAISYTWSKSMLEWRKWILSVGPEEKANQVPSDSEASGDMEQFHLFFTVVSFFVLARGKSLFWMDVLSIDQNIPEEKAFFVPKMGLLYAGSPETHAYVTGSAFVSLTSDERRSPIWETRAWTVQEYVLSKNVIYYCCFSGDVMRDLKVIRENDIRFRSRTTEPRDISQTTEPSDISQTTEFHSPTLDRYKFSVSDNTYVLEKGKAKVTCCFDEDTLFTTLAESAYMPFEIFGPNMNQMVGHTTLGKILYNMKRNPSRLKVISTSIMILAGRTSTLPEDMMYSILGILEMEDHKVRYGIEFPEARIEVFEGMKPDVLAIVLGTDWGCSQGTKNNDSALPRIINSEPTIGIERWKITNSAKYKRDVGTTITSRKEKFRLWKDLSRRQTRNLAVVRATMGSQTSRLMIMFCASLFDDPGYADIPTSEIPEENIRPVIVSGESRLSDDDYLSSEVKYDKEVELVELGVNVHHALFADVGDEKYMTHTAVLALECEESSGSLVNRGTVLVLDAYSFSGTVTDHTVQ